MFAIKTLGGSISLSVVIKMIHSTELESVGEVVVEGESCVGGRTNTQQE